MPDQLDQLTEHQLALDEARIQRVRQSITSLPKGICLNCEEQLQPDASFCDTDCRTDYEKRRRMKGYAGMG